MAANVRAHSLSTLGTVIPEFAAEVSSALSAMGRNDLASQIAPAVIERCSYDSSVNAGYIHFVLPMPSSHSETFPFFAQGGFNIDVDHRGLVSGIELLSRDDVFSKLRQANAL